MTFEEAEARFRELHARVQRGEPISRADFEDQVSRLAVLDQRGVLWEIHPRLGKWMYFDGAEWVTGIPPGREHSTIMPLPPAPIAPAPAPPTTPPAPRGVAPAVSPPRAASAPSVGETRPSPPAASASAQPRIEPTAPVPTAGPQPLPRIIYPGPRGGTREWIPFAIGAAVLLFCSILLFLGGGFVLSTLGTLPTPTQMIVVIPNHTPVPTVVRLPTPTPTPAPVLAKVIERRVNVRAGPSLNAKIVDKINKDELITLIGLSQDGKWYQVMIVGRAEPAWVFGETLEVTSGDPKTLPVIATPAP